MKTDLWKTVFEEVKGIVQDIPLKEEKVEGDFFVIEKAVVFSEGKKIKATPISYGYNGIKTFIDEIIFIDELEPDVVFKEELKGKILYIHKIPKLKYLHFLKKISPAAVITNTPVDRPIFIREFPILYIPSFIQSGSIKIQIKNRKKSFKTKNFYFDIGAGPYFFYIHFPFDSFFDKEDRVYFNASLKTAVNLIKKLLEVKYPRGYRIRFLFTDMKFMDYYGLKQHLKNENDIISVFHIENTGMGNEKLIIKNINYLLDDFHYKKIHRLSKKGNQPVDEANFYGYSTIEEIDIPVVWFTSQPAEELYNLKKDFLNEKLILNFVNKAFYFINNLYRANI